MNDLHELIPLGVGMALSPLPIVALVAIVLAPRGRVAAPVFTSTFTLVSLIPVLIGALASASVSSASASAGSRAVSFVVTVLVAVVFVVLAVLSWHSRPRHGQAASAPRWLAAIDTVTPATAAGLGFLMAAVNSKNVPLALKGGALIGEAHLPLAAAAGLCIALALAGSVLLIVPALLELGGSARIRAALQSLKSQLIEHNAAMMTVLFAILAANEAAQIVHRLVA